MANDGATPKRRTSDQSNISAGPYTLPELNMTSVHLDLDTLHLYQDPSIHDLPELELTDAELDLDSLFRNCGVDSYIPDSDDASSCYQESLTGWSEDASSSGSSRPPTPPPKDQGPPPDLEAQPLAHPITPLPPSNQRLPHHKPSTKSLKDANLVQHAPSPPA
ncbi:MAG: hypothetical protein Q9183_005672 [Haloplaca sp. 2 TL-2023]